MLWVFPRDESQSGVACSITGNVFAVTLPLKSICAVLCKAQCMMSQGQVLESEIHEYGQVMNFRFEG